jgi:hypothetical protein
MPPELGRQDTLGQTGQPDATFDTDPGTLTALLRNDRQLTVALRAGDLRQSHCGTHR